MGPWFCFCVNKRVGPVNSSSRRSWRTSTGALPAGRPSRQRRATSSSPRRAPPPAISPSLTARSSSAAGCARDALGHLFRSLTRRQHTPRDMSSCRAYGVTRSHVQTRSVLPLTRLLRSTRDRRLSRALAARPAVRDGVTLLRTLCGRCRTSPSAARCGSTTTRSRASTRPSSTPFRQTLSATLGSLGCCSRLISAALGSTRLLSAPLD